MKITMESADRVASIEIPSEATLQDALEELGNLLKIFGYSFDGYIDIFNE